MLPLQIDDPAAFVAGLTPEQKAELDKILGAELSNIAASKWEWLKSARPTQLPPPGDWLTWLVLAGRGFGKTRCGAEWVRREVTEGRATRIALIAETQKDLEEVMVFGQSGLASVFPPHQKPRITKKPIRIEFHTGAVANGYNATEPDQLRGPQFDAAWCFVAGTMVATPRAQKPIETLVVGDLVLTRSGPQRIVRTNVRTDLVGRITFSNQAVLIGTAEHPVYLKSGWTRLDQLRIGDIVCALDALNGAARSGTAMAMGPARITNEPTRALNRRGLLDFIAKCGLRRKGQFLGASRSITRTTIKLITPLITLSALRRALTCGTTLLQLLSLKGIGIFRHILLLNVENAELALSVGARRQSRFAKNVKIGELKSAERCQSGVFTAQLNSLAELETFAVSVASTWQPLGEQRVYCLTVEDAPEYFANGILVHNCDELAKFRYARDTWDQLQFGLRLGNHPRQIITTTPRPIPILKEILAASTTVTTRGITLDNKANLAPSFIKSITDKYAGTRLGRQELSAEILDDVPDALWTRAALDRDRRKPDQIPTLKRIVVAVDPAAKKNDMPQDGAATGIIVAGIGEDNRGYVIDDQTCRESPNGWARMAVSCFDRYQADCIVGEINNGGEMVAATVRAVRPLVPFREVHASKGKWTRAEPVAALYEQGRVSHVGMFAPLEDEMVNFGPNGLVGDRSPDRVDALVWALTQLFPLITRTIKKPEPIPLPKLPTFSSGIPTERGTGWMGKR